MLLDLDIIQEFDLRGDELNPAKDFAKVLNWLAKQINIIIRHKRMMLSEHKPGAVYGKHPTIIFVKVVRRATYYPLSTRIGRACAVRVKFNEVMNTIAAQFSSNIMNISNCVHEVKNTLTSKET